MRVDNAGSGTASKTEAIYEHGALRGRRHDAVHVLGVLHALLAHVRRRRGQEHQVSGGGPWSPTERLCYFALEETLRDKIYSALVLAALLHGSELWCLRE